MLNELASSLSYFGIVLTGAVYLLALWIQKKTKLAIFNPLVVSCAVIMILLIVTGIDYDVYLRGRPQGDGSYDGTGAAFFQLMLTPTTVALAIPLYEKLAYLKKYPLAIFGGITAGALTSVGCVLAVSLIFNLNHVQYVTMLPKSITSAIGMGVSEELGGLPTVTVALIVITGIFGNMMAGWIMKLFKIHHPVAVGLACGTGAHAMGTSRAREFGEVEEAMSGLSIAVCGLLTVVLASLMAMIHW